jgi:transposase
MNVLKHFKQTTILTLTQNKISQHEIARKTGVDRKTIRKYQGLATAPPGASNSPMATGFLECMLPLAEATKPPGSTEPTPVIPKAITPKHARSACEPHHDWIAGEVGKGRNAVSIYQDLVERFGFAHRYNSVKRYVRGLKKREPEQYDRLEFLPGEEAQVDYGQGAFTKHPVTGKRRRPRLFVMTLRYSRKVFRKVVWNSSAVVWGKLHEEAFRYFSGVPQYVVLDNLKEGVLKPDIFEPELNPVYSAMLAYYGVVADPARVCDPNRKGTVENGIQHTQNTALKGREFETIEEQNQWLMHWEEKWAAPRIHGRTKRQVQEMFLEEKPFLKALPLQSFRYFKEEARTVWDDGCVQVGDCYYSACPAPLYSKVMVRIYDCEIEIYDPTTLTLIRRHFKSIKKGHVEMKEEDRIFNPSRQTEYFFKQAEKIGPKTKELCELLFKEQGRVGQRRMRGILSLAKKHPIVFIEQASSLALDRQVRSSKIVRELVERLEEKGNKEKQQKNAALPLFTQTHELIRNPCDYARFFETHASIEKNVLINQPREAISLLSKREASPQNQGHQPKEEPHANVTN